MRLLGIIEKSDKELLLIQDKDRFFTADKNECKEKFDNYSVIKNRDISIGNGKTQGEGVFNFRYGPVTAGVAEAGIFNIYTYGERILSVEIDPTYKKRNIEKQMIGRTPQEALQSAEGVCGNFAFSHSLSFSRAIENICGINIDETSQRLRIIALELERIYNNIHVIARLSKGAAQNVLTSHIEWIFEEALRINKLFCKSRFLKNLNAVGGVNFSGFDSLDEISKRISIVKNKFKELYNHSLKSWNFVDRLYKVATLTQKQAMSIGITGPSLRSTGVNEDLRRFDKLYENFQTAVRNEGDALARMENRADEIVNSCNIVISQIEKIRNKSLQKIEVEIKDGAGIGFCESPSGIIAYYIELKNGLLDYAYISTPSVFGFKAFADVFVGYIFTDFSFSLDSFGINFADCAR